MPALWAGGLPPRPDGGAADGSGWGSWLPGAGYHSSVKRHGFQSHFHSHEHRDGAEGERPSKSQLKREMTALQELGERLLALPPQKLRELPELFSHRYSLAWATL